jgi:hypothetical protein
MKKVLFFTILVWPMIVFLFIPSYSFGLATGVTVVSKDGRSLRLYNDYQAVVVGVSTYQLWPQLPDVAKDARDVAEGLKKMGFNVKSVMNPTYRQFRIILTDLVNQIGNKANRAVLFYYIGHGETAKLANDSLMGYLIPVDCPPLSQDPDGFLSHAISMKEIEAASTRMKAKHVMMIFDAFFSGSQFQLVRPSPEGITTQSNMPVRQYIIAGRAGEKAPQKRMFNRCFLTGLDGYADLSEDGYITGSELAMYLSDIVTNSTQRKQHPQYGKINNPALNKGDFVFVTSKRPQQVSVRSRQVSVNATGRQKELEEKIRALDSDIMKTREKQRKMEAQRTVLMEKLRKLRGEPSPEKKIITEKRTASKTPQLQKKYKTPETQKLTDATEEVSASSSTDDVQRQLELLQERTKMLEEKYRKLQNEKHEQAYEKPPESRSAEGLKDDLDMLRERNKILEEQRRMLKTEQQKEKEEEPDTIWGGGDDPREENLLGGP